MTSISSIPPALAVSPANAIQWTTGTGITVQDQYTVKTTTTNQNSTAISSSSSFNTQNDSKFQLNFMVPVTNANIVVGFSAKPIANQNYGSNIKYNFVIQGTGFYAGRFSQLGGNISTSLGTVKTKPTKNPGTHAATNIYQLSFDGKNMTWSVNGTVYMQFQEKTYDPTYKIMIQPSNNNNPVGTSITGLVANVITSDPPLRLTTSTGNPIPWATGNGIEPSTDGSSVSITGTDQAVTNIYSSTKYSSPIQLNFTVPSENPSVVVGFAANPQQGVDYGRNIRYNFIIQGNTFYMATFSYLQPGQDGSTVVASKSVTPDGAAGGAHLASNVYQLYFDGTSVYWSVNDVVLLQTKNPVNAYDPSYRIMIQPTNGALTTVSNLLVKGTAVAATSGGYRRKSRRGKGRSRRGKSRRGKGRSRKH